MRLCYTFLQNALRLTANHILYTIGNNYTSPQTMARIRKAMYPLPQNRTVTNKPPPGVNHGRRTDTVVFTHQKRAIRSVEDHMVN